MATSAGPQNHSHHLVLLTLIAVMISVFSMLGISYIRFLNSVKNKAPQNYEDFLKLKDSIISLSYPQICTTKDGKSFVQTSLSPTKVSTLVNKIPDGWTIYSDNMLGISFYHPKDWLVNEPFTDPDNVPGWEQINLEHENCTDPSNCTSSAETIINVQPNPGHLSVQELLKKYTPAYQSDPKLIDNLSVKELINANGIHYFKIEDTTDDVSKYTRQIFILLADKVVILNSSPSISGVLKDYQTPSAVKEMQIIDQLLETINFTKKTQPSEVVTCTSPRPKYCTKECLTNPPYLCGSNGKSYCSSCQACADTEVDWYRTQDNPCTSPTTTLVPETQPYNCCGQTELNQGYECLQGCSGPVARENEPAPPFSCLNPTMAYSRKTFGCPICLASNTYILTPQGSVKVTDLKVGMPVWSLDKEGNKIAVPILRISKTRVPQNHRISHLVLSDGRKLDVSPNHPDISGKPMSLLQPGDLYDKSVVLENSLLPYWDLFTYDLLPDSETGLYFANGILLQSTLKY